MKKTMALSVLIFATITLVSAVALGYSSHTQAFKSPDGNYMAAYICSQTADTGGYEICNIVLKKLKPKAGKYQVVIGIDSENIFLEYFASNKIYWSPDSQYFVLAGGNPSVDCGELIVIFDMSNRQYSIVDNGYNIQNFKFNKSNFSYTVVDDQVETKKCNDVLLKKRKVIMDYSGNKIKEVPFGECGEGFC